MEKIKVKLNGDIFDHKDIVEFKGQSIPKLTRIEITADIHEATRITMFSLLPETEAEIEPYNATIIQIKAGGVSIEDARSLLVERDLLKAKCNELEKQLNEGVNHGKNEK